MTLCIPGELCGVVVGCHDRGRRVDWFILLRTLYSRQERQIWQLMVEVGILVRAHAVGCVSYVRSHAPTLHLRYTPKSRRTPLAEKEELDQVHRGDMHAALEPRAPSCLVAMLCYAAPRRANRLLHRRATLTVPRPICHAC